MMTVWRIRGNNHSVLYCVWQLYTMLHKHIFTVDCGLGLRPSKRCCNSNNLLCNDHILKAWSWCWQSNKSTSCCLQCLDTVGWLSGRASSLQQNWLIRCWRGYLSSARCKWYAHSQADATADDLKGKYVALKKTAEDRKERQKLLRAGSQITWRRCNCHPIIPSFIKIDNGLIFRCQLTLLGLSWKKAVKLSFSYFTGGIFKLLLYLTQHWMRRR